jgi:hypothetical protein
VIKTFDSPIAALFGRTHFPGNSVSHFGKVRESHWTIIELFPSDFRVNLDAEIRPTRPTYAIARPGIGLPKLCATFASEQGNPSTL